MRRDEPEAEGGMMDSIATTMAPDPEVRRVLDRARRAMAAIREGNLPDKLNAIATATAALHRLPGDPTAAVDELAEAAYAYGLDPDAVQAAIAAGASRGRVIPLRSGQASREPPRPLMRQMPPADAFPVDALGVLAAAARAIQERTQAPVATCGQSVLAAATLAVQGLADVELPTRQVRPISCFFVTVAATGERKTSVDSEALRPVRRQEADLREEHFERSLDYQNELVAWEKAREASIKKLGRDRAAIKATLDELGARPTPPWLPVLIVQEPTYEGLCKLLAVSRPSLGIFSNEGGQFMGGHGMADDAKLRTAAGLSALWDGDAIKRVRADGTTILPDRRLSMHLMAQPDVAGAWLNDPLLADQGLLSRVLVSAPDSTAGTRFWREWSGSSTLTELDRRIFDLVRQPLPIDQTGGGVRPRALTLSPAARRAWIDIHDWTETRVRPGGEFEAIRGLANKLPEHAARLAAVLTMAADCDAGEVEVAAMNNGITLAQHYAAEALRLFQGSAADPDLRLAEMTLAWLRGRGEPVFYLPEVYRLGPAAIRDKATAAKVIGILADHGHLESINGGAEIGGKWRRDVWRLVSED
jgi:hypothetical protein